MTWIPGFTLEIYQTKDGQSYAKFRKGEVLGWTENWIYKLTVDVKMMVRHDVKKQVLDNLFYESFLNGKLFKYAKY